MLAAGGGRPCRRHTGSVAANRRLCWAVSSRFIRVNPSPRPSIPHARQASSRYDLISHPPRTVGTRAGRGTERTEARAGVHQFSSEPVATSGHLAPAGAQPAGPLDMRAATGSVSAAQASTAGRPVLWRCGGGEHAGGAGGEPRCCAGPRRRACRRAAAAAGVMRKRHRRRAAPAAQQHGQQQDGEGLAGDGKRIAISGAPLRLRSRGAAIGRGPCSTTSAADGSPGARARAGRGSIGGGAGRLARAGIVPGQRGAHLLAEPRRAADRLLPRSASAN